MKKIGVILKREFYELLPPTIFFFIAIGLLMLTKRLVLRQYGIQYPEFAAVVVGALIVGKVVLIADQFSFVNKYPGRPLIYNVLWKTTIYLIAAFIVRAAEEIIPKMWQNSNVLATLQDVINTMAALLGHSPLAWRPPVRLLCAQRTRSGNRQR